MIRQFSNRGHAPPLAYVAMNTLVWVIYVALVLLATQILSVNTPVAVAATTLAAAIMLTPVRRRAAYAVRQRFNYR